MAIFGESKPKQVNAAKKPSEDAVRGTCPVGAKPNTPSGYPKSANVKSGPYHK